MKKIIKIIFFLLLQVSISWSYAEDIADVNWKAANTYYRQGNYSQAIELYQSIPEFSKRADVLYNLGNAYYKTGRTGKAILAYEKALVLMPAHKKAKENLAIAQDQVINPYVDSSFVLVKWLKNISGALPANVWALLFMVCSIALVVSVVYRYYSGGKRNISWILSGACMLVTGLVLYLNTTWRNDHYAIALHTKEYYYSDPVMQKKVERSIPEGTKVDVLEQRKNYWKVQLPNGVIAYLPPDLFQLI